MSKKYRCKICNKKCIDNYPRLNELNKKIWCDSCTSKLWNMKNHEKKN